METEPTISLPSTSKSISENVFELKNTFSEHGNEIQEIISKKLPFVVRWGTAFFFVLLMGIAGIAWLIKYPDIVTGKARLTGINTPKEIITRTDGRLQKMYVSEGEIVQQGQLLGSMESLADASAVMQTGLQLDSIAELIASNRTDEIVSYFPTANKPAQQERPEALGELQTAYQQYIQAFISFKDFLKNGFYLRKKKMLQGDIHNLLQMHAALDTQKTLLGIDVDLSTATFKANEKLYTQKVIALFEYRSEQSKLIGKQLALPQAASALLANESQQNEKLKEIADLENQVQVQKNSFIQALHTLQSQLHAWEYKYLLKAPIAGVVAMPGFMQEGQELKANQILFYIQPANSAYYAEMLVPQYNFGKVKPGQMVLLKFQAYPYEQYGQLMGEIAYIKNAPTDSGYLVKVVLPNGLFTNYKKKLPYHYGLLAQADIVTEDMRLLQRFYYTLAKQFTQ